MIKSPDEFIALVDSGDKADAKQASEDEATLDVWLRVIEMRPDLRFDVAQNKTVPEEVLVRLAADPDARVRGMVARKRKASAALLAKLAVDRDSGVRLAVAYNLSTPREVLELQRNDTWEEVARKVADRLADEP